MKNKKIIFKKKKRNNDKFYFLQNNTNRDYNANITKIIHIFFKIKLKESF